MKPRNKSLPFDASESSRGNPAPSPAPSTCDLSAFCGAGFASLGEEERWPLVTPSYSETVSLQMTHRFMVSLKAFGAVMGSRMCFKWAKLTFSHPGSHPRAALALALSVQDLAQHPARTQRSGAAYRDHAAGSAPAYLRLRLRTKDFGSSSAIR